jgi:phosphoribosyl 1,2-cyclic phosphodiesterase
MANLQQPLDVTFWGTRASYPFFLPSHRQLGGDTSCVGLRHGQAQLFIDAGTGLMHAEPSDGHDVILFSHFHLDHVLGLPYFLGKKKQGSITLASAACADAKDLQAKIDSIYGGAAFPVSMTQIAPGLQFVHVPSVGITPLAGWQVRACALNHPGTAFGYRVSAQGDSTSLVYLTDHEHGTAQDDLLAEFAHGASLVVWDASYDDRHYAPFKGWGHSTWQEGLRFGQRCGARQVALSHHDPARDDATAALLQAQLQGQPAFLACDRMQLALTQDDLAPTA